MIGEIGEHDDELVTPESGDQGGVHEGLQRPRHRDQELISSTVAETIVHDLEVVQVDEAQGHDTLAARRMVE